jgi:membrane protease YdiL (CAAX protease family)
VVVAYVGGTAVAVLLASIALAAGARTDDPATLVASFAGLWGGFVGVPVYLSRTRGTGRVSADFGVRFGGPGDLWLGVAAGLVSYGLVEVYAALIRALGDHADLAREANQLSGHGLGPAFWVFAVCVSIGAPFAEEVFFRGLAQPVLQRHLGGVGGLVVTAVAFGFAHLGANPVEAVVPLALFGAVLGALAWRTGRLGPGMVAHFTFNAITVVYLAFSR